MGAALLGDAVKLSVKDTAMASSTLTVAQINEVLKARGIDSWFEPSKIVGRDTPDAKRGFTALGVAVGSDAYVKADIAKRVGSAETGGAVADTKLLALLGDRPQHRFQLLTQSVAQRIVHLKRQVHPAVYAAAAGPAAEAVGEELAVIAGLCGVAGAGSAHGLPPPAARQQLPVNAAKRASWPRRWGGCGIAVVDDYTQACAAHVAATAASAGAMYRMINKMGGWGGPQSAGYDWAKELLVHVTTVNEGSPPTTGLHKEFCDAWAAVQPSVEWFGGLADGEAAEARRLTCAHIHVAGREAPIEIKMTVPKLGELQADAGNKHSKLQRSLSTVVALQSYMDVKRGADEHTARDLEELRMPHAAAALAVLPTSPRFSIEPGAFAFMMRCRLGLRHGLSGVAAAKMDAEWAKAAGRGLDHALGVDVLRHEPRLRIARHDAAKLGLHGASVTAGAGAVTEPADYLVDPLGTDAPVTTDAVIYWPRSQPVAVDVVVKCLSNLRTSIDKIMVQAAKDKRDGKGNPAQRDAMRAAHADAQSCLAAIQAAGGGGAELADAREAVHAAAQAVAGAYLPGQGEAARRAGASFYPFVMTAAGGLGKEARAAIRAIAHPGDGLGLGEPGARFQAADAVYNTRRHSQYLISTVAVAFWNASHRAAADKAGGVPPRQWSP